LKLGAWSFVLATLLLSLTVVPSFGSDPNMVIGITEPFLDVTLSASVPGIITARKFKEGDAVKEGDTLIELDKRLEELEVQRRKVVLDARRKDFEATARLFQTTKGTSKEEMEKKESEYKLAQVEHTMAEEQLRRRVVIASLSGIVMEFPLDVGESCQALQPVARVVDVSRCYFVANVPARLAADLSLKKEVSLEIETGAGVEPVKGVVTFLSPVADAASGLVKVKILFENAAGKIRPGLAGRMRVNN
jgi:RND family efflux transporter MFP subunit